jgi:hypothetical protein
MSTENTETTTKQFDLENIERRLIERLDAEGTLWEPYADTQTGGYITYDEYMTYVQSKMPTDPPDRKFLMTNSDFETYGIPFDVNGKRYFLRFMIGQGYSYDLFTFDAFVNFDRTYKAYAEHTADESTDTLRDDVVECCCCGNDCELWFPCGDEELCSFCFAKYWERELWTVRLCFAMLMILSAAAAGLALYAMHKQMYAG